MKKYSFCIFISLILITSVYSVGITTCEYPGASVRIYANTRPAYFRGDCVYNTLVPDTVSVFVENDRKGRCINKKYTGTRAVNYLVRNGYFRPYTYCSNKYYVATPQYISYYDKYYAVDRYIPENYYHHYYRTEPIRTVTTYMEPLPQYQTYTTTTYQPTYRTYSSHPNYRTYSNYPRQYRTVRYVDGRSVYNW